METFGVVTLENVERVAPLKANPTLSDPVLRPHPDLGEGEVTMRDERSWGWTITREAEVGVPPGGAELFVRGVDQLLSSTKGRRGRRGAILGSELFEGHQARDEPRLRLDLHHIRESW